MSELHDCVRAGCSAPFPGRNGTVLIRHEHRDPGSGADLSWYEARYDAQTDRPPDGVRRFKPGGVIVAPEMSPLTYSRKPAPSPDAGRQEAGKAAKAVIYARRCAAGYFLSLIAAYLIFARPDAQYLHLIGAMWALLWAAMVWGITEREGG